MRHQGMKLSACGQELGGDIKQPNDCYYLFVLFSLTNHKCYFHIPYGVLWNTKRFVANRIRKV